MTRRDFLWLMTVSTAGFATGCATNPVTGDMQLMLMTEQDEIQIDQEQAPHMFSADYGEMQDPVLNHYISEVSDSLAKNSHRPNMPYSFRAVNATRVNAYAFPGGTIAVTRGLLTELENEAELAALMGHEIGHVTARHTAESKSKQILANIGTSLAAVAMQFTEYADYSGLVYDMGGLASGALLAHYSRNDEREADSLGMEYMTRNGHNPEGMVGLHEILMEKSKRKPSALEMMFATHPMSQERHQTTKDEAASKYPSMHNAPLNRERYMDHTAKLRQMIGAIDKMQDGEQQIGQENYSGAASNFKQALRIAPNDYAGLVLMAKAQFGLNRHTHAARYAERAKHIQPQEAQAHHISGVSKLAMNRLDLAYQDFKTYEQLLPGNPNTIFLKGVTLEGMQQRKTAANEYTRYLNMVKQGSQAEHAFGRLTSWGYTRKR